MAARSVRSWHGPASVTSARCVASADVNFAAVRERLNHDAGSVPFGVGVAPDRQPPNKPDLCLCSRIERPESRLSLRLERMCGSIARQYRPACRDAHPSMKRIERRRTRSGSGGRDLCNVALSADDGVLDSSDSCRHGYQVGLSGDRAEEMKGAGAAKPFKLLLNIGKSQFGVQKAWCPVDIEVVIPIAIERIYGLRARGLWLDAVRKPSGRTRTMESRMDLRMESMASRSLASAWRNAEIDVRSGCLAS